MKKNLIVYLTESDRVFLSNLLKEKSKTHSLPTEEEVYEFMSNSTNNNNLLDDLVIRLKNYSIEFSVI